VGNGCIPGEFPHCCATGACWGAHLGQCQTVLSSAAFAQALDRGVVLEGSFLIFALQVRQGGSLLLWESRSGLRGELTGFKLCQNNKARIPCLTAEVWVPRDVSIPVPTGALREVVKLCSAFEPSKNWCRITKMTAISALCPK